MRDSQPPIQPPPGAEHEPRLPLHTFPPPIIVPPLTEPHRSTLVFLHGRGSSARIFAPPFLSSPVAGAAVGGASLREALPHTRFVFPTAPRSRATIYKRSIINQWYDGSGDWEETVLGHARGTVEFIHRLVREESSLVGGANRVILGGFSQGCATALVCLLMWRGEPLGGVVGMCGMLPMADALVGELRRVERVDGEAREAVSEDVEEDDDVFGPAFEVEPDPFDHDQGGLPGTSQMQALNILREEMGFSLMGREMKHSFEETPVFLAHGTEDDRVLLRDGRHAAGVLRMMGCRVEFKTYTGLGHWYSEDMLGHVVDFVGGNMPGAVVERGSQPEP